MFVEHRAETDRPQQQKVFFGEEAALSMYLVVVMRYCEVNACISFLHLDGVIGLISKYHTLIFVFCRVPFKKKMPRDVCLTVYIGSFWMPIPRAQTLMERRHGYTTRTWNVIFAYLVLFERSTLLLLIR